MDVEWHFLIFLLTFLYFKDQIKTHISTCCDKSDGLLHEELRAASSAQIAILHRISSGRQLKKKRKKMDEDRILTHSRVNGAPRIWLVLLGNS